MNKTWIRRFERDGQDRDLPMQKAYIRGREAAKGLPISHDIIAMPSKSDFETPQDYAYALGYADARNEAFSLEAKAT